MPSIRRISGSEYVSHEFANLDELKVLPFVKAEIQNLTEPYSQEEFDDFQKHCEMFGGRSTKLSPRMVPPWSSRSRGKFHRLVIVPIRAPTTSPEISICYLLFVERTTADGLTGYPIGNLSGIVDGLEVAPLEKPSPPITIANPKNGA